MRLARELDYTPAAAARSLETQRRISSASSSRPARATPTCSAPVLLRGARRASSTRSAPRATTCCSSPPSGPATATATHSYLKRARHHNVAGVVLMDVDPEDAEVRRLVRSRSRVRRRRRRARGPGHGVRDLRQRRRKRALPCGICTSLGHRRIATITGLLDTRAGRRPPARLPPEVQALGLAYRDEYVAYGDFYVESGHREMARLLALAEPPTAVVAASDLMALGAIRAVDEAGVAPCRTTSPSSALTTSNSPATSIRRSPRCGRTRPGWERRPARASGADRGQAGYTCRDDAASRARRPRLHDVAAVRGVTRGESRTHAQDHGSDRKSFSRRRRRDMRRRLARSHG